MAKVPVVGGAAPYAEAAAAEDIKLCVDKGSKVKLTADMNRFVYAPIKCGDPAGLLHLWVNDTEAALVPLRWAWDVQEVKG